MFAAADPFDTAYRDASTSQSACAGSQCGCTEFMLVAMPARSRDAKRAWTVGLAAGLIEGAPLRLAAEMARVVDDGDNLHVLPIVTRGPTENVNSLLYLRGIDLAIINSDSLEEYRAQFPEIRQHVN